MDMPRARMHAAVVLAVVALVLCSGAAAKPSARRPSAERIVGVLHSVAAHRITIEVTGRGVPRTFRTDVLTTVCYEPNICLESGDVSPLLPGARVTAQVATDTRGTAHASTIFVTSVAATIRVDSLEGDVITGRSTGSGAPFTIVRGPFTIVVDAEHGELVGGVPDLRVGGTVSFTGLAGFDAGRPVTIAARLFA